MAHDPVLAAAVQRASQAVTQTAASPANEMSGTAVANAQPELKANIQAAIAPVIANATNTEAHFWQKRTFWSTLASVGVAATAALNYYTANFPADGKTTLTTIGFALWAGYSAFRAGTATTPLGTNPVAYRG